MNVIPTIQDGKVISISVDEKYLPLRRPLGIDELPKLIHGLEGLSEYVDFSGQTDWAEAEVRIFIQTISSNALAIIVALLEYEGFVEREVLEEKLDIRGRVFGGSLSSPGQFFSKYGKTPIYETERKSHGGKYKYRYRIKPEYRHFLEKVIGEAGAEGE